MQETLSTQVLNSLLLYIIKMKERWPQLCLPLYYHEENRAKNETEIKVKGELRKEINWAYGDVIVYDSQFACNSSFDIQMFLQIVEWWIEFLLSTESYITGFFFTFCNTIDNNYSGTISSVLVNGQTLLPPFHTIYWVKSSVKSITHCSNFYLESILIKLDI